MKFNLIVVLFLIIPFSIYANSQEKLKTIKADISKYEKSLKNLESNKKNLTRQLELINLKRSEARKALQILSNEINSVNDNIKKTSTKLNQLENLLKEDKDRIQEGIVFLYDNSDLYARMILHSYLLEDSSLSKEIIVVLSDGLLDKVSGYMSKLNELELLKKKHEEQKRNLSLKIKESSEILAGYEKDSKLYSVKLQELNKDEKAKKDYINKLKKEEQKIRDIIIKNSKKKSASSVSSDFAKYKGRLPYPISGTIIEPFGNKVIAQAGITVKHKGVKIKPSGDGNVSAVFPGTVVYVDNISGMENIVILQHDSLYYTIYANLDSFYVKLGDKVSKSTILGRINVDLNIDSAYLYFEIRKKEEALNPAIWIKN